MTTPTDLALLNRARRALEKATDLREVADLRSKAKAMAHYLRRRDGAEEAARRAIEIRLRAERRLGQLLRERVQHRGGTVVSDDSRVPPGVSRDQSSSWQRIAELPEDVFERTLAESSEPTTAALVRLWRYRFQSEPRPTDPARGRVKDLHALAASGERFGTVYADPPWASDRAGIRRYPHYMRMSLEEILTLPVRALSHRDAHLWLWTTNGHLPEALDVVRAWGFQYRTLLTWRKPRMGVGWWLRSKTEHIVLAARTKRRRLAPGRTSTIFEAPTRKHSQKPEEAYKIIEQLSPGPRLELFARGRAREGWSAWGNELANR